MYVLNHRRRRARTVLMLVILVVVVGVGAFVGKGMLKTETVIGTSPAAVVKHVTDKRPTPKRFETSLFTFDLPSDWEAYQQPEQIAGIQSWRNTKDNKGVRNLNIYTDAAVQDMAVNRVLAVQVNGNHLTVAGDVSDNCVNFTTPGQQSPVNGKAAAKWQSVAFLCDTGNYARNVVGLGAPGTTNSLKLTGPTAGNHSIFMTYTDNSASPDYSIFTSMVPTFQLK